ncbi:2-phosphosulfolactate phosphatase [Candidatus Chrysopegis kryptomonas]|uniref:Probable 2-phosphosulfolactate phosphatase n=1 Tax=Candidatus Chryseopegocella kryptomonas TaxID=1633643 RepID=A0A0P1P1R0_9BACT|nr:2-phosphosulfolactate phosphatase [Candidatus Chrysopegis kryptomonas]CUT05180.1 2-phosphosulfolactate phosphatase [Candidatus Chrysopegis kryptomonas]
MNIDLYFTPLQIQDELSLQNKTVIVVDVLRASTTIATALKNGARVIIPTASVENAVKYASTLEPDSFLLCGERGGKIIDGFHLGNSPLEYTEEKVKGKTLIYASTNGSVAITKTKYAKHSIIAGFVNISEVVNFVKGNSDDVLILCSGKLNRFCIEDAVCGGMIAFLLTKGKSRKRFNLSDSVNAGIKLYKSYGKNLLKMLRESEHGKFLIELGFEDDLKIASEVDSIPILPVYSDGVIKALR